MSAWSTVLQAPGFVSLIFTTTLVHAGSEAKWGHAVYDNSTWKAAYPNWLL